MSRFLCGQEDNGYDKYVVRGVIVMKLVHPQNFYITEWAAEDPRCVARMERLMAGFGVPTDRVQLLREEELAEIARAKKWLNLDIRQGQSDFQGDPDVVFNKLRFLRPEERDAIVARYEILRDNPGGFYTHDFLRMLYGLHDGYHYEDGPAKQQRGVTCWTLYDLHSAYGCFHKCRYCRRGRVTTLALNIEEYLAHLDNLIAANPWQHVFRYDVETDCLILEPEYGICQALVEYFAQRPNKYLILFSKSDNVDFLLDLPHRGHTIMLWTLSTSTVSCVIEKDTATMKERIAGARKCQAAGYTVRFKCKPIIPIAAWREEATEMFEKLFAEVQPDNISLEMLFFDTMEEFKTIFPVELFDLTLLQQMEEIEASTGFQDPSHPFPDDLRAEIYAHYIREIKRLSPETRVSLCAETPAIWERLRDLLGCGPQAFACNCGPAAIPNIRHEQLASATDGKAVLLRADYSGGGNDLYSSQR